MHVEILTYHQAVRRLDEANDEVERLEEELRSARRRQRIATAEMNHALHTRLAKELP